MNETDTIALTPPIEGITPAAIGGERAREAVLEILPRGARAAVEEARPS